MNRELLLDTETFCEVPIRNGTHAYAESAEIMVLSYAIDDPLTGVEGPIVVVDLANGDPWPDDLTEALADPDVRVVGHNFGMFDRAVLRHNGVEIAPERIEDTMVQAQSHGLPGGLDKLCEIFKVPEDVAKHKGGKNLIGLFCSPQPKNRKLRRATKQTHPVEWQRFLDYAGGDISSVRYLRKVMPRWNYPGKPSGNARFSPEYENWLLDQKINDRGFLVDQKLARNAVRMVERHKKTQAKRTQHITEDEVQAATQRDALLQHLLSKYGVTLPDMKKGTLQRRLEDDTLHPAVKELIAIRLEVSGTASAKYNVLLKGVSADGRLRGTLQFCGAARTGRWAGRLFQPQNMPRPDAKDVKDADGNVVKEGWEVIEDWITAIKSDAGELILDDPMRAASNAIRGSIVASEGHKLVVADLSNIEGRVLAWLADESWKLKAFADYDAGVGHDLYHVTAGGILGKDPSEVTPLERQNVGKVPELACGYQGSVGAFSAMAALYGLELAEDEVKAIVTGWRAKNSKIKKFWYDLDRAAREAVEQKGVVTTAGRIKFQVHQGWLRMLLPSGRVLCYSSPAIIEHPMFENSTSLSYMGVNPYTRQWSRQYTYGGKLAENATQAVARDVMAHNMPAIEEAGFPIILTVHDEIITEPLDKPEFTSERLEHLLAAPPVWADSKLPLAAGGFETYRYRKD